MEIDISPWQGLTDWKNDVLGVERTIIRTAPDTYLLTLDVAAVYEAGLPIQFYYEDVDIEPANS